MKRKMLAVALILCMVLGMFSIVFGEEEAGWRKEPTPSINRYGYAAAAVGEKIYIFGGTGASNEYCPKMEIYDTKTKVWSESKAFPAVKQSYPVVTVGGTIYVVGGNNGGYASATMESYNPLSGTWTTERSMPILKHNYSVVTDGRKIYVIGGNLETHKDSNSLEIYDTVTSTWSTGASMPTTRWSMASVYAEGKIYVIAGRQVDMSSSNTLQTVEIYDIASNTWSTGASFPVNKGNVSAIAIEDKIYAVGGGAPSGTLFTYDTNNNSWIQGSSLNGIKGGASVNVNGRLYVLGTDYKNSMESIWIGVLPPNPTPEPSTKKLSVLASSNEYIQLCVTENLDDNATVNWSSSDGSVATVDSNGKVTAVSAGVCDITALDSSGFSESISVRVAGSQGEGTDFVYEKVNDTDSRITYSGSWTPYSNDSSFYNNDEHFSKQADSYAEFTFEGTGINWIGATSNNLGMCDVYIDGELVQAGLDQYSSSLEAQKVLFSQTGLTNGQHTIKIVITGEKNSSSIDVYGTVDAFEVIRTE